jgi:hypothetical protein
MTRRLGIRMCRIVWVWRTRSTSSGTIISTGASLFVRGVDRRAGGDATVCNLGRHDARSFPKMVEYRHPKSRGD